MYYSDEEKLVIEGSIGITKRVQEIIEKEKKKLEKKGRKVSRAKIICNLVIEKYEE